MWFLKQLPNLLKRETSNGQYLPLVDGLRFLAIMPVIVQHISERLIRQTPISFSTPIEQDQLAFLASRGTIGVFIFFAISGFMLSLPFAKHQLEGAKVPNLKQYFIRRFTRIEPPYLIWMTVFALVLLVKGAWTVGDLLPHWLASSFYLHNFIYGEYSVINPVAWSLEIEIQFYLIAPWLVGLFFSIKNGRARQWVLLGSIFGFVTLQHAMGWQNFPFKLTLLGQMQHFLVGIWLADAYLSRWQKAPSVKWAWDLAVVPALLVMAYTWTEELGKSLIFAVALMVVFMAAFQGKYFSQLLKNQWVAIIGGMCYSIYLTHLPLLELQMSFTKNLVLTNHYLPNLLLQLAIGLPLVLVSSGIFYLVLEKPFMGSRVPASSSLRRFFTSSFRLRKAVIGASAVILLVLPVIGFSQTETTDYPLPPLDTLVKMAIEKSPALRSQDVWIETKKQEMNLEKKSWANLVTVGGTALLGTNNVLDYQQTTTNQEYISVDRRSAVYNAGLTVRLSLGDVINRSDKVNIKRLEWERTQVDKLNLEAQIQEEVLVRYDRFQADMQLLQLEAQNVEAMQLALEVAQKYFEEGTLPASEYTTVLSKNIAAKKQLEESKLAARHSYRMLCEIAGI
ncbi:MAG: acyltransferase family protein [Bacteroidetes bacterium]|nr:acyltransferase family protein [Bacteroidota bacterium]